MLKQIKDFYRIGLTWTSNALEGNSLTESETKVLIEDGLTIGSRPLRDMFEAVDHAKAYPVEFAAILHKRFLFIHPFKDGNGRVARLLMNTVLIQDGYLPALIPPVLRSEYISLLEKAHTNDSLFISFISDRELESQKDFLRLLHITLPKLELI